MKRLTEQGWKAVHEKACDIANAVLAKDDVMVDVYKCQLFELLEALEYEFGIHSEILATRADFMENVVERRKVYEEALRLAREQKDKIGEEEILDSLRDIEDR
jgi:hypothetical protein